MKRTDLFAALAPDARRRLRKRPPPTWVAPMLAVLTDERFSDKDWVFERKFDGIRCLAFRTGRRVRLISRNRQDQNNTYPELLEPLLEQDATDFIIDGEVVAFDGKRTSFARLQQRMGITDARAARRTGVKVYYYVFDLLRINGFDTTALGLRDRKRLLERAFDFVDPLRFSTHWEKDGEKYYEKACRLGWEGLIAK